MNVDGVPRHENGFAWVISTLSLVTLVLAHLLLIRRGD